MYSSIKKFVVKVQFCQGTVVSVQFYQEMYGQCTVLSSNLWSMYSSVKKFVVNVQFCQATSGQCTVLSSNLWSMYSPSSNLW